MEYTDYCFSFFRKPIQNIEPLRAIGVVDVYRYVVGHYAQPQTETLRSMTSPADVKKYIHHVEHIGMLRLQALHMIEGQGLR